MSGLIDYRATCSKINRACTWVSPHATPRESTEAMVRNIGRELAEIEHAIDHCRGDRVAEPRPRSSGLPHGQPHQPQP
jgi:hypothetical protein